MVKKRYLYQKNDLVEGNIKIKYNKYKVNRGISDKIFK